MKGFAMRKATLAGFALALLFSVSGCGDSLESVMKDTIKLMNEKAEILESIKDKDSAEKAKPKLEALNKKKKDIEERAKKQTEKLTKDKKPEEAMKAALEAVSKAAEKHKEAGEKARNRLKDAAKKVRDNKEAMDVLKDIDLN